jgi:hypothetical protein
MNQLFLSCALYIVSELTTFPQALITLATSGIIKQVSWKDCFEKEDNIMGIAPLGGVAQIRRERPVFGALLSKLFLSLILRSS